MLFFFYGTLTDDALRSAVLAGADCRVVGQAWARGSLYDAGEYPALVLRGSARVPGLLCEVDEAAAARLDTYEGVDDGLYARRVTRIESREGLGEAWTYEYLGSIEDLRRIERWQAG